MTMGNFICKLEKYFIFHLFIYMMYKYQRQKWQKVEEKEKK